MNRAAALTLAIACAAASVAACGDGATPAATTAASQPKAAVVAPVTPRDAASMADGDVVVANAAGVRVIVRRVPGSELAAAQLYIRGGTRNWTADNAGIERLAWTVAAAGGTKSLDKTAFTRRLAALGATIRSDTGNDFSSVNLKAPRAAWDDSVALLADVFRAPLLPPSEIDLARQQLLAELHHEAEGPDGRVWTLERKLIFAGHPYANRPLGTLDSMASIHAEDLAPYLQRLREKSRLLFVAVGDVDPAHVVDQVTRAFGDLPQGSYVETPLPKIEFGKARLVTEERKLPTNYVYGVFTAPAWRDPDFVAANVAMSALGYRLWEEVRTKRNLTYSINAFFNDGLAQPLAGFAVSAVDPNATMKVVLDELRRFAGEPMAIDELAGVKSAYLTEYLQRREAVDGQALALAEGELYAGDWRVARAFPDRVRAVTAADVQAYAQRYLARLQVAVLGNPAKVDATLFTSL